VLLGFVAMLSALAAGAMAFAVEGEPPLELTDPEAARFARATFDELMKEGADAFDKRQYQAAARGFYEATLKDPRAAKARFAAAHSLFAIADNRGEYRKAAMQIRSGLVLYPDWPDMRMNRRDYYTKPADFDEQLGRLKRAILDNPSDPVLRFLLGYNLYFTQDYRGASWEFLITLNLDQNFDAARAFLVRLNRLARRKPEYDNLPHTDDVADRYGPEDPPWIKALREELERPARSGLGADEWIDLDEIDVEKKPEKKKAAEEKKDSAPPEDTGEAKDDGTF
jgi:hypothetical protein